MQIPDPSFKPVDKPSFDRIKDKLPNSLFTKNRTRFFKLFKDQVDELKLKQIMKLQKGPLLCIKDDQKVREFVEIC